MKRAMIDYIQKEKIDEYYTPEIAVNPLINYLSKDKVIWEPTDNGQSNITKVLRENGFTVIYTGKERGFDFLSNMPDFHFDMIVTNPPYSLKTQFLKRCYEFKRPFCLLLPITALEGVERHKLYRRYGIELLLFDRRINFLNSKKNVWFNTSWFCWKVLPVPLIFERVKK